MTRKLQTKEGRNNFINSRIIFLAEKKRLLAKLTTTTSMKEFQEVIKTKSISSKIDSQRNGSQFNPYDIFD